jgi:hypothetical protein
LKVLNIHSRIINEPLANISELLKSLSLENDRIWPIEKWPAMKFKEGIFVGSKGGHGPIRYSVEKYDLNKIIQFSFISPKEFIGIHAFEVFKISEFQSQIKHTIDMNVKGKGIFFWYFAILHLHNALIEDAFDKIENNFSSEKKITKWNLWVIMLRKILS